MGEQKSRNVHIQEMVDHVHVFLVRQRTAGTIDRAGEVLFERVEGCFPYLSVVN
jgi:hypothetical protein